MRKRFEDKVVLITGAANGLGLGMAEQFLLEGAKIAALDIEKETLEKAYAGREDHVFCAVCDVSDYDQVQNAVTAAADHFGRIDILMNNAGICPRAPFLECSKETWDKGIVINLSGNFYMAQAVARVMVEKGTRGVIVNTSSVSARKSMTNITPYCPSKAAVSMLTKVEALELAQYGIRVNAFGPGTSKTRISEGTRFNEERNKAFLAKMPLGRYGEVQEAVDTALFLASDEASFILGETLYEDGGFCLP